MPAAGVFDPHARRILAAADEQLLTVRLLGGLAIWMRSPEAVRSLLERDYADIDLIGYQREGQTLRSMLEALGYLPDTEFNMYQGRKRLYYNSPDGSFHIDVFLDVFEMSHTIDLRHRLGVEPITLPASDLLLTKLQIAEINEKDVRDTAMLLLGHDRDVDDAPGVINVERLSAMCAANWGLYTTVTDNLLRTSELLGEILESAEHQALVRQAVDELIQALEQVPKARAWRLRAKVGRRVRWYTLPEEVE